MKVLLRPVPLAVPVRVRNDYETMLHALSDAAASNQEPPFHPKRAAGLSGCLSLGPAREGGRSLTENGDEVKERPPFARPIRPTFSVKDRPRSHLPAEKTHRQ